MMYLAYQQRAWGEWPQAPLWAVCLLPAQIDASYQAGAQPILDLRPFELAVFYQWRLDPAFALWLDVHAALNEVARAALATLDYRFNLLLTIVSVIYTVMEVTHPKRMPQPRSMG